MKPEKIIQFIFFKSEKGNMPVRDFLLSLSNDDCDKVGQDLMEVEYGWPI